MSLASEWFLSTHPRLSATQRYTSRDRAATQMLLSDEFAPAETSAPTDALPGSREKVEVLAQRAMAGEELWHPCDATFASAFRKLRRTE